MAGSSTRRERTSQKKCSHARTRNGSRNGSGRGAGILQGFPMFKRHWHCETAHASDRSAVPSRVSTQGASMKDIVILGGARTPIGSFLGTLASLSAPRLGSIAIKCALANSGVQPDQVEQVIMRNVLQAAVGPAPARQAGIAPRIPVTAP